MFSALNKVILDLNMIAYEKNKQSKKKKKR
jgi:hypothetical protein